jgi:hypothetical protein
MWGPPIHTITYTDQPYTIIFAQLHVDATFKKILLGGYQKTALSIGKRSHFQRCMLALLQLHAITYTLRTN